MDSRRKTEAGIATVLCVLAAFLLSTAMLLVIAAIAPPDTKVEFAVALTAYTASVVALFVALRRSFAAFVKMLSVLLVALPLTQEQWNKQ